MKNLNILKALFVFFVGLTVLTSCDDDDDNVKTPETISEIAAANPNLTSLVAALTRANLVQTLDNPGTYTVFAPTNAAFSTFLSANNFASLDAVPVNVLTQVLLNHVIAEELPAASLTTGYKNTLASYGTTDLNLSMFINTANGVRLNGVSSVSIPNVEATNGVIHVVDAVIGLPTVVTFATADPNFSTLVAALTRESSFTFVSTLSSTTAPAPFTVFAPTNTAFGSLLTELNVANLAAIPTATLSATLNMHVVAGANVRSTALTNNMSITTLGGTITANITGGATLTDSRNRVSNITAVNVQAVNGVIHVINKVILPPSA